ncbi:type IV pilus assembly protein PilX [Candidatus Magnetomoraceae bacterium gMMP-1]
MNILNKQLKNDDGFLTVLTLLMLALLTIIGVSATTTSNIEVQIAANDRDYRIAFHNADSGIYITPKIIAATIKDSTTVPTLSKISYLGTSDDLFREIMGFNDTHDDANDIGIGFISGANDVEIDIEHVSKTMAAGSSAEFGSGAEGTGTSSKSGVSVFFNINAEGTGPRSSNSNIAAGYRYVDVPGGL